MPRRTPAAALLGLLAAGLPPVWAQEARGPAAPRRIVLGGEAVAAFAGEDDGYFNETDYGHNVLRQLRLRLAARWQPLGRLGLLAEVRSDDLEAPHLQALYVRVQPSLRHPLHVQAGRIPPVFGAFARRRYTSDNPLIGYPLAYQYLVALRPDAVPSTSLEIQRMRGRGWQPFYGYGSRDERGGLPLVSALSWDAGIEARYGEGAWRGAAAVTQGTLSNPRFGDDNGGKQFSARLSFSPGPALVAGLSASRGPWLTGEVTRDLGAAGVPDAGSGRHQTAFGLDLEASRGYWIARAEAVASSWDVPTIAAPHARRPLRALGVSVEARYRLAPGIELGARGDHLGFSTLSDGVPGTSWEAPVWRVEAAGSVEPVRRLRFKAAYQHNWRDGGFVRERGFLAAQASWWF